MTKIENDLRSSALTFIHRLLVTHMPGQRSINDTLSVVSKVKMPYSVSRNMLMPLP